MARRRGKEDEGEEGRRISLLEAGKEEEVMKRERAAGG